MSRKADNIPDFEESSEDTGLASVAHILGLITGILGPIILYAVSDDEFVERNSAKAFTWQLFFSGYLLLSFLTVPFLIGFLFLPILLAANFGFSIVAAVKASKGEVWKYPGTVHLLEDPKKIKNGDPLEPREEYQTPVDNGKGVESERDLEMTEERLKKLYLDGHISDEEFEERLDNIQNKELDRQFN